MSQKKIHMGPISVHSWTGTPGTPDGVILSGLIVPQVKGRIKNLQGFENEYSSKPNYGRNYRKLYERLCELDRKVKSKISGNIDVIEYLHLLYFGNTSGQAPRSLDLISDWLQKEFNFFYPSSSLQNLFKKVFGWELRENTDITETTTKRNRVKITQNHNVHEGKQKQLEGERKKISETVQTLLEGVIDEDFGFDLHKYLETKKAFEKMKIIFESYYEKDIYELIEELHGQGYKAPTISVILNMMAKELILIWNLPIREYPETSKNTIAYILKPKTDESIEQEEEIAA